MTKFKVFIDFDKEERWLERWAARGWLLTSASYLRYRFAARPPQQVTMRIDYRTFKDNQSFLDYCAMFEDSGWLHVGGTRRSGAQYFRRIHPDAIELIDNTS